MTPSFPPVLLSRTHLPTHRSGRRALQGFILDAGGRGSQASPAGSASPVLQVDTASVCGSFYACEFSEIIFANTPARRAQPVMQRARGRCF